MRWGAGHGVVRRPSHRLNGAPPVHRVGEEDDHLCGQQFEGSAPTCPGQGLPRYVAARMSRGLSPRLGAALPGLCSTPRAGRRGPSRGEARTRAAPSTRIHRLDRPRADGAAAEPRLARVQAARRRLAQVEDGLRPVAPERGVGPDDVGRLLFLGDAWRCEILDLSLPALRSLAMAS